MDNRCWGRKLVHWLADEKRKCILCKIKISVVKCLLGDCHRTEPSVLNEEEIVEGKRNEAVIN